MDVASVTLGWAALPAPGLPGWVGDTKGWVPRVRGEEDGTRSATATGKGRGGVVSSVTSARAAKQNSDFYLFNTGVFQAGSQRMRP